MNNRSWPLLAVVMMYALCGSARAQKALDAAGKTFNLTGTIVHGTCNWSVTDSDSVVELDPVRLIDMPVSGAVGFKSFQVAVSGCSPDLSQAVFAFNGTPDASDPQRYKSTGTATGMAIELQSMDGQTVGANGTQNERTVAITAGQATLPLKVAYWHLAGNPASVGTVESTAVVTMSYQ